MLDFEKIKVIIWDLDETLWDGTLSEGEVCVSLDTVDFIRRSTDYGIVHSICSKNNYNEVKETLCRFNLWDFFVFPSIDWTPKGKRLSDQIGDMNLRFPNVLFLDDNKSNLGEAEYYCNGIMTATPEILQDLFAWIKKKEPKDIEHKRLAQYKLLERKSIDKSKTSSNDEFLRDSRIVLRINHDCITQVDRITDLVQRTNQLNYTKVRSEKKELIDLFNNKSFECGYVEVNDKYGDYGIVGFYALYLPDNTLLHFLFSCRTLGMGIEQFVYSELGYPNLMAKGEIAHQLQRNERPNWINVAGASSEIGSKEQAKVKVLLKGPCDMSQLFSFLDENDNIITEFTYVGQNGSSIEMINHTECIREAYSISDSSISTLVEELPFADIHMFSKRIYSADNRIVFLSLLTDGGLGLYRRKNSGEIVAYGEYCHPLTDRNEWDGYISGKTPSGNVSYTEEMLDFIAQRYEYIGRISIDRILDNVKFIRIHMPESTLLVLLLGAEIPFQSNNLENYNDRHVFHKELNNQIKELAKTLKGIEIIDFNLYVTKQSDFYNNINHFVKPVYYKVSKRMVEIINESIEEKLIKMNGTSKVRTIASYLKQQAIKITGRDKFNRAR